MVEEEKIAQGTYDFRNMRKDGYRYVDKTALLYPLVHAWDGLLLLHLASAAFWQVADALDAGVPFSG